MATKSNSDSRASLAGQMSDAMRFGGPLGEYMVDAMQRTILFWDVMRQRSEQYQEHKSMPVPNVLHFDVELVLDGHKLERAANYLLLRIKPPKGVTIDPMKRAFVVVDPRAGHGPGIGGFKADSELGVAMRAGHPSYYIGFTPDPVPGQTIEDILRVEEKFLEKIVDLHPDAEGKPCVIGNCQSGWAVVMLAAVRPDLFGPIIIPGSPLSYWAGVKGQNPMRYLGGLLGGSWLTALTCDLGGGKFDGGYLVSNFEGQNPANTYWAKNYDVYSKVDTEAERFLEFEKWWGGHVNLNAEEIQWIVDELFIGNRLATGEITTSDGVRIDLRNIRSPIVCFCSHGDNITPPQQSLGWIVDLYESDEDIKACGQTIVYAVHETVGHLGIFVSGGVAKKEHMEFTSNIDLIDVLPPGLYEVVLTPKSGIEAGADMVVGDWITRLEMRTLDDVHAIIQPDEEDELRFATVRRVSEINHGLYRTLLQPFVKAMAQGQNSKWLHKMQPAELPYELFSEQNPLMEQVAAAAEQVREQRTPSSPDNPFVQLQQMMSSQIIAAFEGWADLRDKTMEQIFLAIYGQPIFQAFMGLRATDESPRRHPGIEPEQLVFINKRIAELGEKIAEGGPREAAIRCLVYIGMAGKGVDERSFNTLREIRSKYASDLNLARFKQIVREQYFALLLDQKAALAAVPKMMGNDPKIREAAARDIRTVMSAIGKPEGVRAERLKQIEALIKGGGETG